MLNIYSVDMRISSRVLYFIRSALATQICDNRGPRPMFVKQIRINSKSFDVWLHIKIKDKRETIRMKYRISASPTIIILCLDTILHSPVVRLLIFFYLSSYHKWAFQTIKDFLCFLIFESHT